MDFDMQKIFINVHQEGWAGGCEWCHLVKVDAFSFKEVSWVHFILQRFFCGNIVDVWNFRHQDLTLWSHLTPTGGCIRNLQFCPSSLPLFLTSENLEAFSIKFLVLAWKSFHFKANGCWLPFTSISIKFEERLQERGAITQLIRRLTLTLSPPESLLTSTSMLMTFGLNIENGLHYFEQSEIWKSIGNNSYLLWDNLKARDSSASKNISQQESDIFDSQNP